MSNDNALPTERADAPLVQESHADGDSVLIRKLPGWRGGDCTFSGGRGTQETGEREAGKGGRLRFNLPDGTEAMRIDSDGTFYVRGEPVERDVLVYRAFRDWLSSCEVVR